MASKVARLVHTALLLMIALQLHVCMQSSAEASTPQAPSGLDIHFHGIAIPKGARVPVSQVIPLPCSLRIISTLLCFTKQDMTERCFWDFHELPPPGTGTPSSGLHI